MSWMDGMRARLRLLLRRADAESRMDEEMRFHMEMETAKNLREGMSPVEARRRAAVAFGAVERYREELRDGRGLAWLPGSWLDVRLGARMLAKYPGLALVGGVGMAVVIAIGAVFAVAVSVVHATLPFPEGERVVAIESWDAEVNNQERRILHDFAEWRGELRSVEQLGAFRMAARNLTVPGGPAEPVTVAEMTASGFRVPRVPPLLGRHLLDEDERPGAPPVVVIGHEVWRSRFGADPAVVGREVRLGGAVHTVVGVMPEGFAFPMSNRLWVPLRADPADFERRQGPGIQVFGRLAPGATLQGARAELEAVGRRTAAAFPATHARLRPRVVPYTRQLFDDLKGGEIPLTQLLVLALLGVVCANVAVLVYARTATRRGEIVVRTALGASRRRIVTQLFAEALVLAGVAAAAGLGIAWLALRRLNEVVEAAGAQMGGVPFWIDFRLSAGAVAYVAGLAVLAAAIVGVVPALKATGSSLESSLRALGGGPGMRMGRTWTALIVAQVAFAVAVLPPAVVHAGEYLRFGTAGPGFPAEEFLAATLVMEREVPPAAEAAAYARRFDARFAALHAGLARRLEAEPGVAALAFAAELPGQEPTVGVEVDGGPAAESAAGHRARYGRVDAGFFDAFGVRVLAGRSFNAGDLGDAATGVVVNRTFARELLGGGSALGRRVRYVSGFRSGGVMRAPDGVEMGRWYEVVGVVDDLPANAMEPGTTEARMYHALAPGGAYPVRLAVRTRGAAPAEAAGRLREVATALDPALQLHELRPLDEVLGRWQAGMRVAGLAIALVTLSVLLLSAAGIYALTSFTVTLRRREIGIRSALGADPRRVLASVFSRAARQLAMGAVAGLLAAGLLDLATGGSLLGGDAALVLPGVAALMLGVGLLAALGPARRGLRIQPMEALREE